MNIDIPSLPAVASAAAPLDQAAPLTVRGLQVGYHGSQVIQGLDWELPRGQVVGLLGRNGSGKTTLLESVLGLRERSAGEVRLFGQPVDNIDDHARARIGFVPQQSDLFGWFTPRQMLDYFKSFYPRWNDAKVDGLLAHWGIAGDQPISRLSGGQQHRLSIIRALAHEPELLVLDEPVGSLDPVARRDFLRELVDAVTDRDTTVVFSTHILSDLERVAFDVAFLRRGRIALQAPLDVLLETTRRVTGPTGEVQALVAAHRLETLSTLPLDAGWQQALVRHRPDATLPDRVGAVRIDAVTLEDLFSALTS